MIRSLTSLWLVSLCVVAASLSEAVAEDWFPFPVYEWNPPFVEGSERSAVDYVPLEKAGKEWRIAVFIPHLKDSYWLAVNYGLVDEARRLGTASKSFERPGMTTPTGSSRRSRRPWMTATTA